MLIRLEISNYALIENVNIQFDDGYTAITGETGAGKSILLKALNLLLGDRADTSILRRSEKKCFLEAEFDLSKLNVQGFFQDNDIDYDDQTILRREFSISGKSRCFVNDSPVQLSVLKELGKKLISIHSQHQTLALFDTGFQMEIVDYFAGVYSNTVDYRAKFKEYRSKVNELIHLKVKDTEGRKESGYIEFLLNELKSADLENIDLNKLKEKNDKIENSATIAEAIEFSKSIFENETYGPLVGIKSLIETFETLKKYDVKFADIHARLLSLKIELDDLAIEIENRSGEVDFNEQEGQIIKEKMDLLNSLCFKHNLNEVDELLDLQRKLEEQLGDITSLELNIQSLDVEIERLKIELTKEALEIREARIKALPKFENIVSGLLSGLGMDDAKLQVQMTEIDQLAIHGLDHIEFLFKTNLGGDFLPIKKTASGGELSRLMLAILSILSETKNLPTLIFDEIDTGVSGEIAGKLASEFSKMGNRIQLIVITHLAQVAGKASKHLHVSKSNIVDKTVTSVSELTGEERVNELAKMISGEEVTIAAKENALHLLKK